MRKPKGTAFPEFLDKRGEGLWDVGEGDKVETNVNDREMSVPLGTDDLSVNIRRHEMARAKYTPASPNHNQIGVKLPVLAAAESMRLTDNLERAGLDMTDGYIPPDQGKVYAAHMSKIYAVDPAKAQQETLLFTVSHGQTAAGGAFNETILKSGNSDLVKAMQNGIKAVQLFHQFTDGRSGEKSPHQYTATEYVAKWMQQIHEIIEEREDRKEQKESGDKKKQEKSDGSVAEDAEDMEEVEKGEEEQEEKIEDQPGKSNRFNGWGEMTTENPPRPIRVIEKLMGRKRKASDRGVRIKSLHRYVTDHKIFQRKAKRPGGGSVLVDNSGSMALDPGDVERLVTEVPASRCAKYEGRSRRGTSERGHGTLTILSKDGRRTSDENFARKLGGNVVDLPALKWLAQQPEPRIWVSDGIVTDSNESNSPEAGRQCRAFRRKHRIFRVDTMDVAIAYFEYINGKRTFESFKEIRALRGRKERGYSLG